MVDITHKNNSLRIATAQALVRVGSQATIDAIESKQVPKGDVFEMSRAAGLLAIKKTPDILPDCHPLAHRIWRYSHTKSKDWKSRFFAPSRPFIKPVWK